MVAISSTELRRRQTMRMGARPRKALKTTAARFLALAVCLGFAVFGLYTLAAGPALWFDEGWMLTVARNWAQTGYYGERLLGQPAPASMLNVGFPAILPAGLSFSVLGIGIWQGRLPALLFTAASLYLVYYLTSRLFTRSSAYFSLFGLLVTSTEFHPLIWGKQALGESSAIFLLLAGFALFLFSGRGSRIAYVPAALCWGMACVAKAQFLPFVLVSLLSPLLIALYRRHKPTVRLMTVYLTGTALAYLLLRRAQAGLVGEETLTQAGLYTSTAFVPVLFNRLHAIIVTLTSGLPSVLGLYFALRSCPRIKTLDLSDRALLARIALLAFALSWLGWYLLLSVAWPRYLYPLVFISGIFLGPLLWELVDPSVPWRRTRLVLAVVLVAGLGVQTVRAVADAFRESNTPLKEVTRFLNSTAKSKVVECYDLEVLVFLTGDRCHHPPDSIQLDLNRRAFLHQPVTIKYDPLSADPDFLVVGRQARLWGLYTEVAAGTEFTLVKKAGQYAVYRRVRESHASPGFDVARSRVSPGG
jgi:hypothetical protein